MNALADYRDLGLEIGGVPILRGVSFAVAPGEAVGLVGESGSGKSLTLRALARLLPDRSRTTGEVLLDGTDTLTLPKGRLRAHRRDLGMVFQDPRAAINPVHTVGSFLLERARDTGGDLEDARERATSMLRRMGIGDPERRMAQYPFELSGGLLQRVMIASVLMERPRLLLADEPTTALDVTTQSDVLALAGELRREAGTAMLLVTHDLDLANAVCDRIVVMYGGRVLETASTTEIASRPVHPYTRGLLASRPPLTRRLDVIPVVPGTPVAASATGPGCPFASRCPVAVAMCATELPEERTVAGSLVRCHRADEVAAGELDVKLPLREEVR
jgi:oligopeptide/dipeptide ABC transporter ATP-binding protein